MEECTDRHCKGSPPSWSQSRNLLFNNAVSTALSSYGNATIERFCHEAGDVFIAGSISDKKDLDIMAHLANCNKDTKFIFVPHEISEDGLNNIRFNLEGYSILYSECTPETDFSRYQTLIIDFIGSLAKIYRYGKWAYVGGGFTKYLHSVVEPAAYGIPVAYGPCVKRQPIARIMKEHGIGTVIRNKHELNNWFLSLKTNDGNYEKLPLIGNGIAAIEDSIYHQLCRISFCLPYTALPQKDRTT